MHSLHLSETWQVLFFLLDNVVNDYMTETVIMKKEKYNIEGIEIEVDKHDPNDMHSTVKRSGCSA